MRFLLTLTLFCSLLGADGEINSKAVIASGVLPGSGEWMLGNRSKAEVFFWIDGILWFIWGTAYWYGSVQNNNAKLFAASFAGAPFDQDANYYAILEDYDNSDKYNEIILRKARQLYPDTLPGAFEKRQEYLKKYGYFGDDVWNWEPDSARFGRYQNGASYCEIRRSARVALQRASFAMGSLILNRIVSAIDALFFTKEKPLSKKIGFLPVNDRPGVVLVYRF